MNIVDIKVSYEVVLKFLILIVNFDTLDMFSLEVLLEEGRKIIMHKTLRIICPLNIWSLLGII